MSYDQRLHLYGADGYGRTESSPDRPLTVYGSREAIMEAIYAKIAEEQRPERERLEREAQEEQRVADEVERLRVAEVFGRSYPEGHVVYYLRFCCRVKIGTTTNLTKRLYGIPHDELLAVEPGEVELESLRHRQFNANRIKGEWFDMTQELFQHLLDLRGGQPWTHMPDSWIHGSPPTT
ncbi:GIY-YIG nuclease family protein [Streptomyces sp. NPDC046925]|uniref:GIY-YIG nuclease family protein n=1 Tax=Streptomyces sp. NPDC046925 TaxID=3155375 RepID=UPI0034084CCC